MDLGIIIPIIESELNERFSKNLLLLRSNLNEASIDSYRIFLIIQTKKSDLRIEFENIDYEITAKLSVSKARNLGIKKLSTSFKYLYFLDQDAVPSIDFLKQSKKNINLDYNLWAGKIYWGSYNGLIKSNPTFIKKSSFFLPFHGFLGCYIIKSNLITKHSIFFNEEFGPGENTVLKCGEDLIFLSELMTSNNISKFLFYKNLKVFHPQRLFNNIKNLYYAKGQSYTYAKIIKEKNFSTPIRLGVFFFFLLFIINSFYKLFFEPNGMKIFKTRFFSSIESLLQK